jgi:hypothetical protein
MSLDDGPRRAWRFTDAKAQLPTQTVYGSANK